MAGPTLPSFHSIPFRSVQVSADSWQELLVPAVQILAHDADMGCRVVVAEQVQNRDRDRDRYRYIQE